MAKETPAAPATETPATPATDNADVMRLAAENALLSKTLEEMRGKLATYAEADKNLAEAGEKIKAYQGFARTSLKAKYDAAPDWVRGRFGELKDDDGRDPLEGMASLDQLSNFYADMEKDFRAKYKIDEPKDDPTRQRTAPQSGAPDLSTHEGMMKFISSLYNKGDNK